MLDLTVDSDSALRAHFYCSKPAGHTDVDFSLGRYGKKQPRPVGLGGVCGGENQINRLTGHKYRSKYYIAK